MKRMLALLLSLSLFALLLSGCAPSKNYEIMGKYDLDTYVDYYWDNTEKVIYHESFLPLANEDGTGEIEVTLLYTPKSIIAVQNYNATVTYEEGKDYRIENGKLYITVDSSIEITPFEFYYYSTATPNVVPKYGLFEYENGKYGTIYDAPTLQTRMILVSYTYSDNWEGAVPASKGNKLPKTLSKLKNGEELTVVCYGDSISFGCDSSYLYPSAFGENIVPSYFELAMDKLQKLYSDATIKRVNSSVGGTGFKWAIENCKTQVNAHNPDLVILAFGMNDGTISAKTYTRKMTDIVNLIRDDCPDAEIVLVSSMLPNMDFTSVKPHQVINHQNYFVNLENEFEGLAFMNMTEIHQYMLTKKPFKDMTSNNTNHPNDFLARAYAQVLLKTLEE